MAVLQFEDESFRDWVRELNNFFHSDSDSSAKKEVLVHFYETAETILREYRLANKLIDRKEFVSLLYQISGANGYFIEKWGTLDGQLELFAVYNSAAVDTILAINPALVHVMCDNHVFVETLGADIPDLQFSYDELSGLYKYITRSSETNYF